jgi:hypothetical protein
VAKFGDVLKRVVRILRLFQRLPFFKPPKSFTWNQRGEKKGVVGIGPETGSLCPEYRCSGLLLEAKSGAFLIISRRGLKSE